MSLLQSQPCERKLVGYILPPSENAHKNGDEDSETEEEEEEKQPEFLDMTEMISVSSGGHMFQPSIPVRNEVDFHDLASGQKCRVEGRFALGDPWWEITCTARTLKHKLVLRGYPAYRLRTCLGRDIMSLFLKACGAAPEFVGAFMQWLPEDRDVDLANALEALSDFEEAREEHSAVAVQLKSFVSHSTAGINVQAATLYPLVMRYLPTLLPGHFKELLGLGKRRKRQADKSTPTTQAPPQEEEEEEEEEEEDEALDHSLLAKLEEVIKTDVWKLGFNSVVHKELRLVRCEARLGAFQDCGLLQGIPPLQRNALLAYDDLKRHCRRTGSTYLDVELRVLELGEVRPPEVWDAVHFLREQRVVVVERERVGLGSLHGYETGIAECLRGLARGEPWVIGLDVREVLGAAQRERERTRAGGQAGGDPKPGRVEAGPSNGPVTPSQTLGSLEPALTAAAAAEGQQSPPSTQHAWDPERHPVELDPDQVCAAEMMCANPVTVISGKGGCGKTTVVSLVFRAAVEQQRSLDGEEVRSACRDYENDSGGSEPWGSEPDPAPASPRQEAEKSTPRSRTAAEVLLTAPTGRAAALLTKKTSFTAYTLHQVLWSFMNAKKDENGAPKDWKFASVRVLVVDEGSLVCVQILHSVLTMLTQHARLQKFILLGDVRQLPSIEPGNTLHDLFHNLSKVPWAIEMKTNHRAESELIVKNAGLIADMGIKHWYSGLDFDATVDLGGASTMPKADKKFILIRLPEENTDIGLQDAITLLLKTGPGLEDHSTSQLIAFRRKECALINELCCKHYSGHITKNHKNGLDFRPGDKVCCTKNGYVTDKDKEEEPRSGAASEPKKERLCNGEIFYITQDRTEEEAGGRRSKKRYLTLDDGDGRVLTVLFRELQRECRLQHAWARTIHTFQGSESATVVYLLGDGSAQTWKHVYTAVTRGQSRVYVMATPGGLATAIRRRVVRRSTRLGGLVQRLLAQQGAGEPPSHARPAQPPPGTPSRPAPGFGPSQAVPAEEAKTSDASLLEDVAFSQAYAWSPMESAEDPGAGQHGQPEAAAAESGFVKDEGWLRELCPSQPGSPIGSKRRSSADDCTTPTKQPKAPAAASPLVSSRLQLLFLDSPARKKQTKCLSFPDLPQ